MKNEKMTVAEENAAIEKEARELIEMGVDETQARETAATNLGIVDGDVIALEKNEKPE